LLNAVGVQLELIPASLTVQAAPAPLPLFESTWTYLVDGLNRFLHWVADRVARIMSWEPVRVKLAKVTMVDQLEDHMARLQLMLSRVVSQTDGLRPLGLDPKDQQRKILDEDRFVMELGAKAQEEMAQAASVEQLAPTPLQQLMQQNAQAAQGGVPGPATVAPGGAAATAAAGMATASPTPQSQPTSIDDLYGEAQTRAQRLLAMPQAERRRQLKLLNQTNPALHHMVTGLLEEMRSQAASQGRDQVMAQTYGQQPQ
jgi:hypothetical protein